MTNGTPSAAAFRAARPSANGAWRPLLPKISEKKSAKWASGHLTACRGWWYSLEVMPAQSGRIALRAIDHLDQMVGRVVTVSETHMSVAFDINRIGLGFVRVGSLIKVFNSDRAIIACVNEVTSDSSRDGQVLTAALLGELTSPDGVELRFGRGVSYHPVPGDSAFTANDADLAAVYGEPSQSHVRVGTLYHDSARPAYVLTNELLTKHFAILGTTGSGKSCALTVVLSAVLNAHPNAHVVLFDPHNEYSEAFGEMADVITVDNLQLPLWLLNFEEAAKVLIRSGSETDQSSQALILGDAIAWARKNYGRTSTDATTITVDTPVPFRIHELLRHINEEMGRLAKPDTSIPYLRLRTRIESLRADRRFSFFFSSEDDILDDVVSRLLRIPVNDKPLTIVDLSGVPSEIADVIVSTMTRIIFDFSVWCERGEMPPVLLACEEAHRYVPADERRGFAQTVRTITQIAKEGRKYGISLALITQRPSELSLQALAQCGTVFALRLGSEVDQHFISKSLPDVARELLSALPSLPTQEAIVSGEGVKIPMRVRLDDLPEGRRPRSQGAEFSKAWQTDDADRAFIGRGIRRWRAQIRS
jgi:uncharacterized protein